MTYHFKITTPLRLLASPTDIVLKFKVSDDAITITHQMCKSDGVLWRQKGSSPVFHKQCDPKHLIQRNIEIFRL